MSNPSDLSPTKDGKPYMENAYTPLTNQYQRNLGMFLKNGVALHHTQRSMYEFIKNFCRTSVLEHPQYPKYIWKPKICDIGCGSGIGSNIMSQEADFVWGIDRDEGSIKFAKQIFERHKNNIYYTPQLTFDVIDIENQPRTMMEFDIVVAIEVIEHLPNYQVLFDFIKRLCKKDKNGKFLEPGEGGTHVFISSPNRDNPKLDMPNPKNKYHVREWRIGEFYDLLTKNFKYVTVMDEKGTPVDLDHKGMIIFSRSQTPQ